MTSLLKLTLCVLTIFVLANSAAALTEFDLPTQVSGEVPKIKIKNLKPEILYHLTIVRGVGPLAKPVDENLDVLLATISVRSLKNGKIDLTAQAPVSGYNSIDAWGALWSARKVKLAKVREASKAQEDILTKLVSDLTVDSIRILVTEDSNQVPTALVRLNYLSMAPGVTEVTMDADQVQFLGRAFLPAKTNGKKVPGIVIWHGSDGEMPVRIAQYYASQGYAALALKYFTFNPAAVKPYLTDHIRRTPIEVAERAIDWLASQKEVDASNIAVYGGSRGGELALLVGQYFGNKISAVIAHRPSHYAFGSKVEVEKLEEVSSWTYQGQDIPYVSLLNKSCLPTYIDELTDLEGQRTQVPVDQDHAGIEAYRFRDGFKKVFENNEACVGQNTIARGRIDTTKIPVPVMVTAGTDDEMWLADKDLETIREERMKSGFKKDQFILVPGSGHVGGIPGDSRNPVWVLQPFNYKPALKQSIWVFGGTPERNHAASLQFAEESLKFLKNTHR